MIVIMIFLVAINVLIKAKRRAMRIP
jgi:hypothetical protein